MLAEAPPDTPAPIPAAPIPADRPAVTPASMTLDTPGHGRPVRPPEIPADRPADNPPDKPAESPADNPPDRAADAPPARPADNPADTPPARPPPKAPDSPPDNAPDSAPDSPAAALPAAFAALFSTPPNNEAGAANAALNNPWASQIAPHGRNDAEIPSAAFSCAASATVGNPIVSTGNAEISGTSQSIDASASALMLMAAATTAGVAINEALNST